MMNLHPYDGRERRFRHTDLCQTDGISAVEQLLHISTPISPHGVLYDLSFYSGGIGVFDRLAITLPVDEAVWADIISALNAKTLEDASNDETWLVQLRWLLNGDEEPISLHQAAILFINNNRYEFQSPCSQTGPIYFEDQSDVNGWTILWGDDTRFNYLGFSQG